MTYEETYEEILTTLEAIRLVKHHRQEWADFVKDHGQRETYRGSIVLEWLGY